MISAYFKPMRRKSGLLVLIAIAIYLLAPIPQVNLTVLWARLASRRIATLSDFIDTWMLCVLALHSVAPQLIIAPLTLLSAWLLLSKPRESSAISEPLV